MGQGANVCHGPHDGSSVTVHSGTGYGLHGCTGKDSRVESSVDRDRLSISCCPTTCVQMDHCVVVLWRSKSSRAKGLSFAQRRRRDGRTYLCLYLHIKGLFTNQKGIIILMVIKKESVILRKTYETCVTLRVLASSE